jgi:phage baseplate assembly protein W
MIGLNAANGQALSGLDHLRQSIRDILTTRIGTRVMRRDYGSRLRRPPLAPVPIGAYGWIKPRVTTLPALISSSIFFRMD